VAGWDVAGVVLVLSPPCSEKGKKTIGTGEGISSCMAASDEDGGSCVDDEVEKSKRLRLILPRGVVLLLGVGRKPLVNGNERDKKLNSATEEEEGGSGGGSLLEEGNGMVVDRRLLPLLKELERLMMLGMKVELRLWWLERRTDWTFLTLSAKLIKAEVVVDSSSDTIHSSTAMGSSTSSRTICSGSAWEE